MTLEDTSFSDRLKQLCEDYFYEHQEVPPCPVKSYERMNFLLGGTRKPTVEELIAISAEYDVSINYLLTGDEMFPSLHRIPEGEAKRILQEIEDLEPEPAW